MMYPDPSALLDVAVEAARAAGSHALANRARRSEVAQSFKHDVKLVLDMECQRVAESVISRHFPEHGILGEEDESRAAGDRPEWVVDPIDGTVNFSHGLTYWCSSVAVRLGERVLAGAVFAPELGELFTASASDPAQLNGAPIRVSDVPEPAGAIALTGLEKTFDTDQGTLDVARRIAMNVQKIRLLGAAALDLCQVAAGRAEIFFESGVRIWDLAAGGLIAERAGGTAELLERREDGRLRCLVTNGRVHAPIRAVIRDALAAR